jgi:hypothetical protein
VTWHVGQGVLRVGRLPLQVWERDRQIVMNNLRKAYTCNHIS